MDVHSEWLLVQKCRAGDEAAWFQLYRVYDPRLTAWIKNRLRARGNAPEEIAQSTWVGLIKNPTHLEAFDPKQASLFRYLKNVAIHYADEEWRSEAAHAARQQPLDQEPMTADEGAALPLSLGLEDILSFLPPRTREVTEEAVLANNASSMEHPASARCIKRVKERVSRCCREYFSDEESPRGSDRIASVRRGGNNQADRSLKQKTRPARRGGHHAK